MRTKHARLALLAGAAGAIAGGTAVRASIHFDEGLRRMMPSILLWGAFFIYWGIASRDRGADEQSESGGSAQFHQLMLGLALLLLLLPVSGLVQRWLPKAALWPGVSIQAGFFALAIWARRHLGKNWSAEVRIAVDHKLVRTGPYRHLRHPIYSAMLGMFAGTAVSSGEVHSLVALALLAVLYVRKTRLEEQILGRTFGDEYDAYRRDSWALIPLVY